MSKEHILVRDYNEVVDKNFITTTMNKGLRESGMFRGVPNTTFYTCANSLVLDLLSRCKCKLLTNPQDPSTIYSFILYEKIDGVFCLHYIYTKHTFRRMGLSKKILAEAEHDPTGHSCYSFQTRSMEMFMGRKLGAYYNPFLNMLDFETSTKMGEEIVELNDE